MQPSTPNLVVKIRQPAGEWWNPVRIWTRNRSPITHSHARLGTSRQSTDSNGFPPTRVSLIQCLTSHGIWWPRKCCMVRRLMATRMVKITIEVEVARVPAVGAFSLMTPRFITAWRGASISSLSDIMISIFSPYTNTFSYHPHRPSKTTIPFLGTAWDNLLQHILLISMHKA